MGRSWYESILYQHAHTNTHTHVRCKLQASADTTSTRSHTHIPIQDRTHGKGHMQTSRRRGNSQNKTQQKNFIQSETSEKQTAADMLQNTTYILLHTHMHMCNVCSCLQRTKAIAKRRLIAAYRVLKNESSAHEQWKGMAKNKTKITEMQFQTITTRLRSFVLGRSIHRYHHNNVVVLLPHLLLRLLLSTLVFVCRFAEQNEMQKSQCILVC